MAGRSQALSAPWFCCEENEAPEPHLQDPFTSNTGCDSLIVQNHESPDGRSAIDAKEK